MESIITLGESEDENCIDIDGDHEVNGSLFGKNLQEKDFIPNIDNQDLFIIDKSAGNRPSNFCLPMDPSQTLVNDFDVDDNNEEKDTISGKKLQKTNVIHSIETQGLFIIDRSSGRNNKAVSASNKVVQNNVQNKTATVTSESKADKSDIGKDDKTDVAETDLVQKQKSRNGLKLASSLDPGISCFETYFNTTDKNKHGSKKGKIASHAKKDMEIMKKSAITPDFERNITIPAYEESVRQSKKQRKLEREKDKGKGWFGLPLFDANSERKNDLLVLQMRKALNPKQFYKGRDTQALPKYCQFGKIVEDPADFYSSRVPKKQRKKTLVDELLADAEFRKYNKRKYTEIQEAKKKATGPYKHMKRLKKKKHLH